MSDHMTESNRGEIASEFEHLPFTEGLEAFRMGIDDLHDSVLQLPEYQPPVQWIFDNIRLTEKESSRPGPMKLTVYQREMANCLNDDENVRQVTVLKGVQIGYSKALAAIYSYFVSHRAMSASIVFPTIPDVKRYYKTEIAKLYKRMDAWKKIVRFPTKGDIYDTWYEQHFLNGADSFFRGAHNDDQLQSYTAQFNAGDEIDRSGWLPGATSIGDKISQLRNRATDFLFPKLLLGSTPGLLHLSLIFREWERSDQRRLVVNCPHCGHPQTLKWGSDKTPYGFRWDLDANGKVEKAWYMCEGTQHCRIDEDDKEDMIESGEYVPTNPNPIDPMHVGIHAPSWISMSPGAAWKLLAQQWLNAQGDIELLKEFVMFKMAEPWDDLQSQVLNEETLNKRQRPYAAEVPDDVILLTCAIDTQTNKEGNEIESIASREASVVGWNRFRMPRLIGHWIIEGEPGDKASDDQMEALIKRSFSKKDGTKMLIQATTIDMGGNFPDQVRAFANKLRKNNVWAIRGNRQAKGVRQASVWPSGKATRSSKGGHRFWTVDTQGARDAVARMLLSTGSDGPMFPSSITKVVPGYFEKLTCERRSLQKNGGYWWNPKKGRRAEEEWICLAYAYVALCGLQASYPQWRDLNVAAVRAGIPVLPPHDPETGELHAAYSGPDFSAQATKDSNDTAAVAASTVLAVSKNSTTQKAEPPAAPKPTGVKRKKNRVARVIRSTRW